MTEEQAEEAILQHWSTGWAGTAFAAVSWTTENAVDDSLAEYARITYVPTVRRNVTLPATRKAQLGRIAVQLFTRAGTGTQRINQMADAVRSVFENKSIYVAGVREPISTFTGGSERGQTDAVWQMRLVQIEFRYDDVA